MYCAYCKHFNKENEHGGQCHRFPPQVVIVPIKDTYDNIYQEVQSAWPWVASKENCGEFFGKPQF